ncbi:Codanin-1 [Trichoplax sp. H2]|nr:Codanin-1 [Trichoplax sp. H2]|eukprot:RDD47474.1 Codanin-1 [Trichoplax sp. H2]
MVDQQDVGNHSIGGEIGQLDLQRAKQQVPQLENICSIPNYDKDKESPQISLVLQEYRYIQSFLDDLHDSLSQYLSHEKGQFDQTTNSANNKNFPQGDGKRDSSSNFRDKYNHKSTGHERKTNKSSARRTTLRLVTDNQRMNNHHNEAKGTTKLNTDTTIELSNTREFPTLGQNSLKEQPVKSPRRITPTRINTTTNPWCIDDMTEKFNHKSNSYNPEELDEQDFNSERRLLRLERAKRSTTKSKTYNSSHTPTNDDISNAKGPLHDTGAAINTTIVQSTTRRCTQMNEVTKTLADKHTNDGVLQILASVYAEIIKANLVPNLTVELYFLSQVITNSSQENVPTNKNIPIKLFNTSTKCVHFVIMVLDKIVDILRKLDGTTVRYFIENEKIREVSLPSLHKLFFEFDRMKQDTRSSIDYLEPPLTNVPFQVEKDNRSNFPNERSFHSFKRQRDMFYALIREWEEARGKPDWDMTPAIGSKIKLLVQEMDDIVNYSHFVQLFLSQLILMNNSDYDYTKQFDNESGDSFLKNLRKKSPTKFRKLHERFFKPANLGSPCPPPMFTRSEKFFRDFILTADSYRFNRHLTDELCNKLYQINATQFYFVESSDANNDDIKKLDQENMKLFSKCILTLRVIAKFLGFLIFYPYHTHSKLPEAFTQTSIDARDQCRQDPVDIIKCFHQAREQHRKVLTIPWIIEYLSWMDPVAPKLDQYERILKLLVNEYRFTSQKKHSENYYRNHLFISLLLGWLFTNIDSPQLELLTINNPDLDQIEYPDDNICGPDDFEVIDEQLLTACCPYLGEITSIFKHHSVPTTGIRKITLLSKIPSLAEVREGLIQLQLEEHFLRYQPPYVKSTVDFTSDSVFNNIVIKLKSELLLPFIEDASKILQQWVNSKDSSDPVTDQLQLMTIETLGTISTRARTELHTILTRICHKQVKEAIRILLPQNTSQQVVECASSIACRVTREKVKKWTDEPLLRFLEKEINVVSNKLRKSIMNDSQQRN